MVQFAFIECGKHGRVNKDDDWLVRAHCMLGKNVKTELNHRAKRNAKPTASSRSKVTKKHDLVKEPPLNNDIHVPPSLNEDLSAYLSEPTDRQSWFYLWRFSCFLPAMYPIDSLLDDNPWAEELPAGDEGALTTALLTASAHNDFVSHLGYSDRTRKLTVHTCSYLNGALSRQDTRSRYSTLCSILHLANAAVYCSEVDTAFIHLRGLYEGIRSLDVSFESVDKKPVDDYQQRLQTLRFKAERLTFCLYNYTGRKGPFLAEPACWDTVSDDSRTCPRTPLTRSPKLDSIYYDLRDLFQMIREVKAGGSKVDAHYYRSSIYSLQLRILALRPGAGSPFDECIRLCITAAIGTQTRLPVRPLKHFILNEQFYRNVPLLECPPDRMGRDFVLWILMSAFLNAFDLDGEDWAESLFRTAAEGIETGEEAIMRLHQVLWCPEHISQQCKSIFEKLRNKWPVDKEVVLEL